MSKLNNKMSKILISLIIILFFITLTSVSASTLDFSYSEKVYQNISGGDLVIWDDYGSLAKVSLNLEVAGKNISFSDKSISKAKIDILNLDTWGEFTHSFEIPIDSKTSTPILDFKAKYNVDCNSKDYYYDKGYLQCGKLQINFNTLSTEVFTAQFNELGSVTKYDVKPQSYLISYDEKTKLISATLDTKYKTELDPLKSFTALDIIKLDPTYVLTNVSFAGAVKSNVDCEGGNSYCHLRISDKDVLFYLPFDVNNTGATTSDWSTLNNDGIVVNAKYNDTGKFGGGFYFDGDGDYIYTAAIPQLDITGRMNISMSAWFKVDTDISIPTGQSGIVITEAGYGSNSYDKGIGITNTGVAVFYIYDTAARRALGTTNIKDGNWHHIIGQFNGTHGAIFVDGNEEASITSGLNNTANFATPQLVLSQEYNGIQDVWDWWDFKGQMDEVMIFNRSLSAAEISQIYNEQFPRFQAVGNMTIAVGNVSSGFNRQNWSIQGTNQNGTNISLRIGQINESFPTMKTGLLFYAPYEFNLINDISNRGNTWTTTEQSDAGFNITYPGTLDCNLGTDEIQYIMVNGPGAAGNLTIGLEINIRDAFNSEPYLFYGDNTDSYLYHTYTTGAGSHRLTCEAGGTTDQESFGVVNLGMWENIIIMRPEPGTQVIPYRNGTVGTGVSKNPGVVSNDPLEVCRGASGDGASYGIIDSVVLWNRALTDSEIGLYNTSMMNDYDKLFFSSSQNLSGNTTYEVSNATGFVYADMVYLSDTNRFWSPIGAVNMTYEPYSVSDAVIDTTPPNVEVVDPTNKNYTSFPIPFNVTTNEAVSSCNFSFDNFLTNYSMDSVSSTKWTATNTTIADGFYTINYTCRDTAGNENSTGFALFQMRISIWSGANVTQAIEFSNSTSKDFTKIKTFWDKINFFAWIKNLGVFSKFSSQGITESSSISKYKGISVWLSDYFSLSSLTTKFYEGFRTYAQKITLSSKNIQTMQTEREISQEITLLDSSFKVSIMDLSISQAVDLTDYIKQQKIAEQYSSQLIEISDSLIKEKQTKISTSQAIQLYDLILKIMNSDIRTSQKISLIEYITNLHTADFASGQLVGYSDSFSKFISTDVNINLQLSLLDALYNFKDAHIETSQAIHLLDTIFGDWEIPEFNDYYNYNSEAIKLLEELRNSKEAYLTADQMIRLTDILARLMDSNLSVYQKIKLLELIQKAQYSNKWVSQAIDFLDFISRLQLQQNLQNQRVTLMNQALRQQNSDIFVFQLIDFFDVIKQGGQTSLRVMNDKFSLGLSEDAIAYLHSDVSNVIGWYTLGARGKEAYVMITQKISLGDVIYILRRTDTDISNYVSEAISLRDSNIKFQQGYLFTIDILHLNFSDFNLGQWLADAKAGTIMWLMLIPGSLLALALALSIRRTRRLGEFKSTIWGGVLAIFSFIAIWFNLQVVSVYLDRYIHHSSIVNAYDSFYAGFMWVFFFFLIIILFTIAYAIIRKIMIGRGLKDEDDNS